MIRCFTFSFLLLLAPLPSMADDNREIMDRLMDMDLQDLLAIKIATGSDVELRKAPAVASVITEADIKSMGALTIDEVLESVPGLHVIPSTLQLMVPTYTFRGVYSGQNQQVMFMLNGNRIYGDIYNGGISLLSRFNVQNIARIEVVRGPGSAIYGADAYSGVINIITKSTEQIDGLNLGLQIGSQNTRNAWLNYGMNFQTGWKAALNLEYFKRNSDTDRTIEHDFQSTLDVLFDSDASLAPSHLDDRLEAITYNLNVSNINWQFSLDGYSSHDNGVGAGVAQAIDHQGTSGIDQYLLAMSYNNDKLVDGWQIESSFSYYYSDSKFEYQIFPPGTILPVGNDGNIFSPHDGDGCLTINIPNIGCITQFSEGFIGNPVIITKMPTFDIIANYDSWENHQLRFNLGYKQEKVRGKETKNFGPGVLDKTALAGGTNPIIVNGTLTDVTGTSAVFVPDKTRSVSYLSIQDVWQINADLALTAGLRFDNYSDFGNTTNPRLALVWNTSDRLITKLLYGKAFRAPTFSELYAQNNPVTLGNNNLKPEKIDTTELSLNYRLSESLSTNLSLYYFKTKDMIEFVVNSDGIGMAQNNRNLTGQGLELEAHWNLNNNWKISANYANQSTKNDDVNKQVEFVPKQQVYVDLAWKVSEQWQLSSQLNWVHDRKRARDDTRKPIEDYQLVNLTLQRTIDNSDWQVAVKVKNLFNQLAREPSNGQIPDDYPLYERRFYVEVQYHP